MVSGCFHLDGHNACVKCSRCLLRSTAWELWEAKSNHSNLSRSLAGSTLSGSVFVRFCFCMNRFCRFHFCRFRFGRFHFCRFHFCRLYCGSFLCGRFRFGRFCFGRFYSRSRIISSSTDLEAVTYQFALAGSAIKQESAKAEYARFEQTAMAVREICQKSRIMYKNCQFWSTMLYAGVAAGIFDTFFTNVRRACGQQKLSEFS
jgi:hypothetical protein